MTVKKFLKQVDIWGLDKIRIWVYPYSTPLDFTIDDWLYVEKRFNDKKLIKAKDNEDCPAAFFYIEDGKKWLRITLAK